MHVDDGALDPGVGETVEYVSISDFPATSTSGFGTWPLCGRMRVPSPAARTNARGGTVMDLTHSRHYSPSGGGTWISYQALKGASAGCANERCK